MIADAQKIMILGAGGMVGSAIERALRDTSALVITPQRHLYDLTRQHRAEECIRLAKPDVIVMAAGKVGGIGANAADQAGFLYENAAMALNVIHAAYVNNVRRLIYLGSSCAYPANVTQPYFEEQLLSGSFEPTNAGYAMAKCLGAELCRHYSDRYGVEYCCVMPCNMYGPGDNYTESGHCVAMLMKRFHDAVATGAATVELWGSGAAQREFMHVDDLASAVVNLVQHGNALPLINVGTGELISIRELAQIIADIAGFDGMICADGRPIDGMLRKVMDNGRIKARGWRPRIPLTAGIRAVYEQQFGAAACEVA